ncbi:MAG: 50S ribosomal protein L23 [Sulfuricurvum sp.]|jgi:large subunit ribosomal protein L23|uniref:50S ribosomal protein L23 n=2 Tax=Sulfuricurvum TaxID=286130 RepID=UPI00029964F7|nr:MULTISPECIES: 50S ribosomal protein L23 [unclassified Sulfuricurvum]OHD78415.1 MAG: 50S ribosomal protein L23 [Sulfuricurvum sp. GWF2_44_89]OHD79706.1 MAG: 50S ribosomal protein L23 [Sulfuricurvum sp. RIFCSPHIGHO2_02_FULL_43_9]OHD86560.1 MAG: 50S ribosomal protein L23 [Sulfuricurvum sp. RIFCSPLOWO2_02_FULL_43_45]OHD86990.1 MAG: 50S ribosomal protein L23 [Sulfuricurvum sp. RIFCSPLOWO2_12_43_5]OHD87129.1 MAG: 50S ribosomal protein L23 [Sulfuricurvum sp. RIFCSPLOWO2_02_43_6]OHD90096.1 MAG: 50
MADITDIKSILYTEKTLGLQEEGVIVVQTSPRMTKNALKEVFREYFGIVPARVNSLNQSGKVKRFRGLAGKQNDFKKFYVKLPEGAQIDSLAV